MDRPDIDNKKLRNFGLGLVIILGLIGGLLFWRGRSAGPYILALAAASLVLSMAWPRGLIPAHRFLIWLGGGLAWINTRIILTLVFYLIFTPASLVLHLMGKDLLDKKSEPDRASYWRERQDPPFDPDSYRHQF